MDVIESLKLNIQKAFSELGVEVSLNDIIIEHSKDTAHGDYATNAAMKNCRLLKMPPVAVANALIEKLNRDGIEKIEIAGPGFINFFMKNDSLQPVVKKIINAGDSYGKGENKNFKVNVEFVSANPTGDLHVGHARGAAIGDSICRIMEFAGYDVTREYYINDAGNQIDHLAESILARYKELLGIKAEVPEDGYHGQDIIYVAQKIIDEVGDKLLKEENPIPFLKERGMALELDKIREDLNTFRVHFDVFSSELKVRSNGAVEKELEFLKDHIYEEDTAKVLRTTDYLDDKDVAAEMTIQLTLDTGEWYRYVIDKVAKEWSIYTIMFDDFILNNASSLYHDPNPIESNHIIHMAFGFKYLYYDKDGNHVPTYAIANPVYLDQISLVSASKTNIEEMSSTIKEDEDCSGRITIETFEDYLTSEDLSNMWSIGSGYGYELLTISEDVSSEGGNKSLDMQYKGYNSVSYIRNTQFAKSVTAHAISLDIKGDGKATVYVNLNWRVSSSSVMKMRYTLSNIPTEWTRIAIGLGLFKDVNGSSRFLLPEYANQIESISFGIVNNDNSQNSHIQMDNIRYWRTGYGIDQVSIVAIDQEA